MTTVAQRKRTKGWRKPPNSVCVSRPSKWGNPFKVGESVKRDDPRASYMVGYPGAFLAEWPQGFSSLSFLWAGDAVDAYSWWFLQQPHLMLSLSELRGKTLLCWCDPEGPCHAHFLAEMADA